MFGIDSSELLIIALVALVVIGPKDLPRVMRVVGQFVGRARGMGRHFRAGLDEMIRESELEEMEKKWKSDNERIMHEFPAPLAGKDWPEPGKEPPPALPGPEPAATPTPPLPADASRPKPPPAPGRAVPPRGAAPKPPPAAPSGAETP